MSSVVYGGMTTNEEFAYLLGAALGLLLVFMVFVIIMVWLESWGIIP